MSTDELRVSPRRRRNNRSPEFKAKVVAECMQIGVSTAAISRQYGLNPNLVHRWVREFEQMQTMTSGALATRHSAQLRTEVKPNFIELPLSAYVQYDRRNTRSCRSMGAGLQRVQAPRVARQFTSSGVQSKGF